MRTQLLNVMYFITVIFWLLGCQNISQLYALDVDDETQLYQDSSFPNAHRYIVESPSEIFAIDQEMKNMVRHVLDGQKDEAKKAKLLLEYIFSSNHIAMSYDTNANVSAAEAFHGQKANCMSLTIMAYVLGKEAGMSLQFQEIEVPEYWTRSGSHQLLMGHVNLLIKRRITSSGGQVWTNEILQIDFDPGAVKQHFPRKIISKSTITAMFYNNKGAEALVDKDFDKAYTYLKAATLADKGLSSAWGNLGILYRLNGLHQNAIDTYKYALSLNPNEYTVLENLSILFDKLGYKDEQTKIKKVLHAKRINNPYYHVLLSEEAQFKGDTNLAIFHIKRAIKIDPKSHDFYYILSKLYYSTEQVDLAQSSIKKALKLNKNIKTEHKYNQKLQFLTQASVNF